MNALELLRFTFLFGLGLYKFLFSDPFRRRPLLPDYHGAAPVETQGVNGPL